MNFNEEILQLLEIESITENWFDLCCPVINISKFHIHNIYHIDRYNRGVSVIIYNFRIF